MKIETYLFRSPCRQTCQEGVPITKAAAKTWEAGADRQEHPLSGHRGGEEGGQKHHWSKAYTKAFSETNTRRVRREEYSQK